MINPRRFALVCMASGAALAFSARAYAHTVAVGTCHSGVTQYPTIMAAVTASAAIPGTTIDVCPGTYPEQVVITTNLTLTGYSSGNSAEAQIVPPAGGMVENAVDIYGGSVAAQVVVIGATVTISNMVVDGTGNNIQGCAPNLEGIYFQNASGTIKDSAIKNQYLTDFADLGGCQSGLGINVESTTGANSVVITENAVSAYQKNGITADGPETGPNSLGPAVTISNNDITGLAATAMNWQAAAPAAENGIQVAFGATGTIQTNTVSDNIWSGGTNYGASGIIVYASSGIKVLSNHVNSAQYGITVNTDPTYGAADNSVISENKVVGTQLFDAIDVCSSSNQVTGNTTWGSTQSGIHVDDTCGSGNNNVVSNNEATDSCAGILLGSGSGNTYTNNKAYAVANITLAGDVLSRRRPNSVDGEAWEHALRSAPDTLQTGKEVRPLGKKTSAKRRSNPAGASFFACGYSGSLDRKKLRSCSLRSASSSKSGRFFRVFSIARSRRQRRIFS